MSGPTREQVLRMAREAGYNPDDGGVFKFDDFDLELFAALVAAAERAKMPPAPLIVNASHIDMDALAEAMKRARPVLVASTPRPEEIAAAVAAEREAVIQAAIDLGFIGSAYVHDFAAAIRARGAK